MQEISANPSVEAEVIVVGAGFAGITAARELKRAGTSVVLLEARDRLGGRSLSRPIGDGKIVDLGCEFHGNKEAVAGFAREIGVESYKTYDQGYKLMEDGGKLGRWKGQVPKVGAAALADFGQAALRIELMRREVPNGEPWLAPHAAKWDSQTMWSWTNRNVHTRAGRLLMKVLIESGMGASPAEISLLHVLSYANGLGSFRSTTSVTGGVLENRFVGGSQAFAYKLAETVADETYVGAEVRRIEHRGDRVRVSGPGFEAVGRRVVVAVPVPLAGRIDYDPVLPTYRDQLTRRMTPGSVIKFVVLYDEPFWRADGLTGTAASLTSPVRAVVDCCPPEGTPGALTAFVNGPPARDFARLPEHERRELLLRQLAVLFGPRAAKPREVIEQNWMAEQYTRGCYHAYAPPGLYTGFGPALREPIGRIHWAGAESMPATGFGSISGAITSGKRVAAEIAACETGERAGHAERPEHADQPEQPDHISTATTVGG